MYLILEITLLKNKRERDYLTTNDYSTADIIYDKNDLSKEDYIINTNSKKKKTEEALSKSIENHTDKSNLKFKSPNFRVFRNTENTSKKNTKTILKFEKAEKTSLEMDNKVQFSDSKLKLHENSENKSENISENKQENKQEVSDKVEKIDNINNKSKEDKELIELNGNDTKGIEFNAQQNKFEFDLNNISEGLKIYGNQVKALNNTKIIHKFILGTTILNNLEKEWKVKLAKQVKFLGVGICLKEQVIKNEFKFFNFSDSTFNHGCYLLSLNGFSWNSSTLSQNNKELKDFPKLSDNEVIKLKFSSSNKSLNFTFENHNYSFKLENVESKLCSLVPCAILLNNNDEITFEW